MILFNNSHGSSNKVFFDHVIETIDGKKINLNIYNNKVTLLVNTASYCGFTNQYDDLQQLWDEYKNKDLIVLGVPQIYSV